MARQRALALEEAPQQEGFRKSQPKPPILPPVQIVQVGEVLALADDQVRGSDEFRRSEPKPPIIPPVQVVAATPSESSQSGTAQSLADEPQEATLSLKEADYNDEIGDEPDPEQPTEES